MTNNSPKKRVSKKANNRKQKTTATTNKRVKKNNPASLVSPTGMGGIYGWRGYEFQWRYIVCRIPEWLGDKNFVKLLIEGHGDVDINYKNDSSSWYEHIQIKNHHVKKGKFIEVLKRFAHLNKNVHLQDIYKKYILACPTLSDDLQTLNSLLDRLRDSERFFSEHPSALTDTEADIDAYIDKLGLKNYQEFIKGKLYFHFKLIDFHDDKCASDYFIINLLKLETYKQHIFEMVKPAYGHVSKEALLSNSKTIERADIITIFDQAIKLIQDNIFPATNLIIHNWTQEKFDIEPDYLFDWSEHFDRDERRVPDKELWQENLLPQLRECRKQILSITQMRHIKFRGKCALATGIALGMIFPRNGDWIFETKPSSAPKDSWYSNAEILNDYQLKVDVLDSADINADPKSRAIAMIFNITAKIEKDVIEYINSASISVRGAITLEPPRGASLNAIANNREAVTFALRAGDELRRLLSDYGAHTTHIFFRGPIDIAIYLGQYLTSVKTIHMHDYTGSEYTSAFILNT